MFKAQQVSCFVQLKGRIAEVVPGHLVTCLIKNALEARAGILQAALQSARAHVKGLRQCVDRRAVAGKHVQYGAAHLFYKTVFFLILPQLLLELWCKQVEQLGITGRRMVSWRLTRER